MINCIIDYAPKKTLCICSMINLWSIQQCCYCYTKANC